MSKKSDTPTTDPQPVKEQILYVDGGIGREIAFSAVLERYTSPVHIIAPRWDLFINHPKVARVYKPTDSYLFDAIHNRDFLHPEPYATTRMYRDHDHIITAFNELVHGEPEKNMPRLYMSAAEQQKASAFMAREKAAGKKIVFFQPFGSGFKDGEDPSKRSLPVKYAQNIVNALNGTGHTVFHICEPHQRVLTSVKGFGPETSLREIIAALPYADRIIGIDSFLQHAAAALNVPAYVFWGPTLPRQFGYDLHTNFVPDISPTYLPLRLPHNIMHTERYNIDIMSCYGQKEIDHIMGKKQSPRYSHDITIPRYNNNA